MSPPNIAGSAANLISTLSPIVSIVAPLIPVDTWARIEEAAGRINPLQKIRSNHVLTRGVRLAWADAMGHVQKDIGIRLSQGKFRPEADFERFRDLIGSIIQRVSDNAVNRDPSNPLTHFECLDSYTLMVLEKFPKHVRLNVLAPIDEEAKGRFDAAIRELTGWENAAIPQIYKTIGGEGFQIANGETRGFDQLLLDAFNVRMSNANDNALALAFQIARQDMEQECLELVLAHLDTMQPAIAEDVVLRLAEPIRELGDRVEQVFRMHVQHYNQSHEKRITPDFGFFIDPIHRSDRSGDVLVGLESLHFRNRQDTLLGRGPLLDDLLENFLGGALRGEDAEPFLWTLIYGDAGMGKSRLAFDLLMMAEAAYKAAHDEAEPLFFGFLDREACSDAAGFRLEPIKRWTPGAPSLVVLDYAGSVAKLAEAIAEFKACAERSKHPIRLVLLDRKATGTLEALALRTDTGKAYVKTRFETSVKAYAANAGIRLRGLTEGEAIEIIRNRLGERNTRFSDAYLKRRLDSIRPDAEPGEAPADTYRPLFAAMIGEFLALRDDDDSGDEADHELKLLDDREEILEQIIARERQKFWVPRAIELCAEARQSEELLERHENLLAMSTFCRGLRADSVLSFAAGGTLPLPAHPVPFNASLFHIMAADMSQATARFAGRALASRRLGFIEPDLIGEWFVLSLLRLPSLDGDDRHLMRGRSLLDPMGFIDLCWDHGDDRLVQFILRCYQNHPDRVRELDYLLPSPGRHVVRVVALVRRIFDEWRVRFTELGRNEHGMPQVEIYHNAIATWAESLFATLKEHVAGQDVSECAEDLLAITAHRIYFGAWLGSSLVRLQAYGAQQSSRTEEAGTRASWLERSRQVVAARRDRSFSLRQAFWSETTQGGAGDAFLSAAGMGTADQSGSRGPTGALEPISEAESNVAAFRDAALRSFSARSPAARMRTHLMASVSTPAPVNSAAALSAKLLADAATFFRTIAEQNPALRTQMTENAGTFDHVASMLRQNPAEILGPVNGESVTAAALSAKLLQDAARFFETIAQENAPLASQMVENAGVFRELADRMLNDPFEVLG